MSDWEVNISAKKVLKCLKGRNNSLISHIKFKKFLIVPLSLFLYGLFRDQQCDAGFTLNTLCTPTRHGLQSTLRWAGGFWALILFEFFV